MIWQAVNPHQVVLVWNVQEVWTQFAQKDLHIAPLETTDANEGGRPRGLSAVCFNRTFLTLLVGENEAFWGSTSPSASGPEGLSRGSVDAQKHDWHNSCAVVGLGDESPPHLRFPSPERQNQAVVLFVSPFLQRALIAVTWFACEVQINRTVEQVCPLQTATRSSFEYIYETLRYKHSFSWCTG